MSRRLQVQGIETDGTGSTIARENLGRDIVPCRSSTCPMACQYHIQRWSETPVRLVCAPETPVRLVCAPAGPWCKCSHMRTRQAVFATLPGAIRRVTVRGHPTEQSSSNECPDGYFGFDYPCFLMFHSGRYNRRHPLRLALTRLALGAASLIATW